MAQIPVGFGQANFRFGGAGWPLGGEVTWGFANAAPLTAAAAATAFATAWEDELRGVTATQVTLNSVLVKLGPNDVGPAAEVPVGLPGTGSSGQVPPNVAILVQKRTALGGRRNRGRIYWPVTEDNIDNGGNITTTSLPFFEAAFPAFFAAILTAGLPLYILHSTGSPTPTEVEELLVQPRTATQRRRLRR